MAQLLVRNLDDEVKARLRRRAARRGHSMEQEARDILRDALRDEGDSTTGLGSRIAARFARLGLTEDIPELRGHVARPAELK
jgi:plasmid stability protein